MKLFSIAAVLCLAAPAFAHQHDEYTVVPDPQYDNAGTSSSKFACAFGPRGLQTHGMPNIGEAPLFPLIGGLSHVKKNVDKYCLTCWELKYWSYDGLKTINITAVDDSSHGRDTIAVSTDAFKALTGSTEGSAQITATRNPACDPPFY